jgi:anaerobic magnesium-protoporphyrin IX monomethyl ester cyclase
VYRDAEKYGISGTHLQPDWDGDWSKFHIHHNTRRWWGSDAEWQEVEDSHQELREFVEQRWGAQG